MISEMKLTRRELAGALTGGAAALAAAAALPQSPETQASEELLKAAIEEQRRDSARIAKLEVPMDTEPAFSFRAL